jgi:hypothetical protein
MGLYVYLLNASYSGLADHIITTHKILSQF